jgi:non-heme chloroperoxidase
MPYFEARDKTKLYYEDFGNGTPLVFTNAGLLTHMMWEAQVAALVERFRTVTWDWRGSGASDKPRTGYTGDVAAADLCEIVEKAAGEPSVLVGHGIGTHVTLLAGYSRPDLVKGMVLASGGPWFNGTRDGKPGGQSEDFTRYRASKIGLSETTGLTYPDNLVDLSDKWLYHKPMSDAVNYTVLMQALTWPRPTLIEYHRTMKTIDHRARLKSITWPVLIIHGRHDRKQVYAGAEYLAENIPNARLVTLENSAHMGQIEEILPFNEALTAFVSELEAPKEVVRREREKVA